MSGQGYCCRGSDAGIIIAQQEGKKSYCHRRRKQELTVNDVPAREHRHHEEPALQVSNAMEALRSKGERATVARQAVIGVLAEHHDHLSADEVTARLADEGVHRTTVYRTLDRFAELGIVSLRQLPGEATAYHLATTTHLHGYCEGCGTVVAIPPKAFEKVTSLLRCSVPFHLNLHKSTLSGLCKNCVGRSDGL